MVYNNVLEAVGHTPMVRLQRMNPEGNAQILVKFDGAECRWFHQDKNRIKYD